MVSMCPLLQMQGLNGWWVNWQISISQLGKGCPLLLKLIQCAKLLSFNSLFFFLRALELLLSHFLS